MRYSKKIISILTAIIMSLSVLSVFAADGVTTGSTDNQEIIVMDNETTLVKGVDYTLEYKDNVNVGTATVIVHFIGNYSGEKSQTFEIKKKKSSGGGGNSGGSTVVNNKPSVTAKDKDDKTINVTHKEEDNKTVITLPDGVEIDPDNPITITIKDPKGNPIADKDVTVKDNKGNEVTGKTNANGIIVVPDNAIPTPTPTVEPEIYEHNAYIKGYEDGTFKPDGYITRAETASMLNGVIEPSGSGSNLTFSDLKNGAWYINAVQAMANAGYIKGYEDGSFKPDNFITRAEFIAMLMRTNNIQSFKYLPFTDVTSALWSADAIYTAYTNGYINGYEDGTFKPDSPITRAEAVKIINAVLDRTDFTNETNPFSDVSKTHWAYKHILEAAVGHNIKKKD